MDNGSTHDTLRSVAEEFPEIEFLWLNENLGVAGGRNAGIRQVLQCHPDYILFLDNDTLVAPDFLTHLIARISSDVNIGAVQPKIYFAQPRDRICSFGGKYYPRISHYRHPASGHLDSPHTQIASEIDIVSGCAGLFRAEVFHQVGLIDETYSPYCHEDVDWSLRLRRAGYRLMAEPKAVIWHRVSSSAVANGPKLKELTKAHMLFLRFHTRFYDLPLSIGWVSLHVLRRYLLPVVAARDWTAVKAIFHGIFLGLAQGYRPIQWPAQTPRDESTVRTSPNSPIRVTKRILLGGVLAPFDSGPTRVYETLLRSRFAEHYDVRFLDMQFARDISDFERLRLRKVLRLMRCLLTMFVWLARERYDAVCIPLSTNRNAFLKDSMFLWIGFVFRTPVVVFEHGTNIPALYQRSKCIMRWVMRTTLRRVTKFIVLGENLKFNFEPFVPSDRIVSVYLGIESFAQSRPPRTSRVAGRPTTVLFLSTLVEAKGIIVFLEALARILPNRRDVNCLIAGGWGWDSAKLKPIIHQFLAREYARGTVSLLGVVKGEDKVRAYDQADILVFPTLADASPHVILEALRAGLPIIASNIGAIPELVKYNLNGIICEPGDIVDLTTKMAYLLDYPEVRERMSQNNLVRFQSLFTADKFADRMISVFQSVFQQTSKEVSSVAESDQSLENIETVHT